MAIYTYRCPQCDRREEVVQSIKSYCEAPAVPICHGPMERYLTPPLVTFDVAPWAAYQSPIDGSAITSKAERNEHMAKHGVVMYDEIAPDIERNKKRIAAEQAVERKNDLIEALHMAEAGHKPQYAETIEAIDG